MSKSVCPRLVTRLRRRRERGQVFMFAALLAPILLGMVGMAIDVGTYAGHKRHLQNASDAIALAAAQQMCLTTCDDTSAATTAANQWAAKNNINGTDLTLLFSGGNTAPKVTVTINTNHNFAFMRIVGINSKHVAASAAAVKVSPGGIGGLMPWAVTQAAINSTTSGQTLTLHGSNQGPGNFGGFDIDGRGGNVYRDTIKYGSTGVACSVNQTNCNATNCPGTFPTQCAENAGACTGPLCTTEPGMKTGPTDQGTSYRISLTSSQCNSFSQVFTPTGSGPLGTKYGLNAACNPWGAGACPVPDDGVTLCSRRVVIIPIIDAFGNGRKDATIQGFALFFLESASGADVTGRFVRADVTIGGLNGAYNPNSLIQSSKLSE